MASTFQHATHATSRHLTHHINIAFHIFKNRATKINKKSIANRTQGWYQVETENKNATILIKKVSTSLISASPTSETGLVCLQLSNLGPFVIVTAECS
jgi:hypothetical protein